MLTLEKAGWESHYLCNTSINLNLNIFQKLKSFKKKKPKFLQYPKRPYYLTLHYISDVISCLLPSDHSAPVSLFFILLPQDLCTGCPCVWTILAQPIPMAQHFVKFWLKCYLKNHSLKFSNPPQHPNPHVQCFVSSYTLLAYSAMFFIYCAIA